MWLWGNLLRLNKWRDKSTKFMILESTTLYSVFLFHLVSLFTLRLMTFFGLFSFDYAFVLVFGARYFISVTLMSLYIIFMMCHIDSLSLCQLSNQFY